MGRQVWQGVNTEVLCLDDIGSGGACHSYEIFSRRDGGTLCQISFQNGPIRERGVNGATNEDLLIVVIDRLRHFQRGDYSCRENAHALTRIEEALHWLSQRTRRRFAAGVEGTGELAPGDG